MNRTKNQQNRQDLQYGHQNQPPKKGQDPNDPNNREGFQPQKIGVNDTKEGEQRGGLGTPHDSAPAVRIHRPHEKE